MSFLLNKINSVNESFKKAGSFNSDIGMFCGFTPIDIAASNIEHDFDFDVDVLNGGMFTYPYQEIGLSAVGKTTLWMQVISACMDQWYKWYGPVAECIFYNVEMHTPPKRWMSVTGYSEEQMAERVRFVSKPYTIIEIYNELAVLAKQKIAMRSQLEIDTGIRAIGGESIKVLPTTYVLIDSVAALRSKTELKFDKEGNVDSETIAGTNNMDAMQIAKDNTLFINEVKKLCEEAKICIVMINHLVEIPVLDRYNPPKPILPSMKYNQKLKGGNELIYQSFGVNMLSILERLMNDKTKIYGESVHGLIVKNDFLKNKNGPEGISYPMVFDSATGYKPELTDFEILYREGGYGISGSPMSYHLDILPEVTFTRKNLLEKCHSNPLLARALSFTTRLYLVNKLINHDEPISLKDFESIDFETRVDMILRYSIEYPGYINNGWVVDEDILSINRYLNEELGRCDRNNLSISNADVEFVLETEGEYAPLDKSSSLSGDTFELCGIEYVMPGNEKWSA